MTRIVAMSPALMGAGVEALISKSTTYTVGCGMDAPTEPPFALTLPEIEICPPLTTGMDGVTKTSTVAWEFTARV